MFTTAPSRPCARSATDAGPSDSGAMAGGGVATGGVVVGGVAGAGAAGAGVAGACCCANAPVGVRTVLAMRSAAKDAVSARRAPVTERVRVMGKVPPGEWFVENARVPA